MTQPKTYRTIQGSIITLRVLEHLTSLAEPASVSEISQELNIPFGTLMTHLYTLISSGYLHESGGMYAVTNKLAKTWADRKRILAEQAQRINKDLKEIDVV
jgi:DNA-binding IclR family transcriptional regulator